VLAVIALGGPPGQSPALTTVGTHRITAVYSGNEYYNGCESDPVFLTIVPPG
jgi:hypothetical protein